MYTPEENETSELCDELGGDMDGDVCDLGGGRELTKKGSGVSSRWNFSANGMTTTATSTIGIRERDDGTISVSLGGSPGLEIEP